MNFLRGLAPKYTEKPTLLSTVKLLILITGIVLSTVIGFFLVVILTAIALSGISGVASDLLNLMNL
jgi:hypothetical protein